MLLGVFLTHPCLFSAVNHRCFWQPKTAFWDQIHGTFTVHQWHRHSLSGTGRNAASYQLCWMEQGRERTRSYPTRQEAEQEKQRRLELLAQGNAPEPFDLLPPHEKRELFAIHERAREKGYELWDVARLHERQLEQQRVPGIEIGKAVKRCLEDKEAEGVSPRSLQSLRSVLLRFASRHEGRLMDELDAADATTFVDTLGVSLRTRLGYLTDLRTIFSWGVQKGLIEVNPVVAAMPGRGDKEADHACQAQP